MSNVKSALLVGVGGQGAILISKIMSGGFMQAGYDVKQSEVHGMAQRGGSVSTQVLSLIHISGCAGGGPGGAAPWYPL